jgi:hypothetical protein
MYRRFAALITLIVLVVGASAFALAPAVALAQSAGRAGAGQLSSDDLGADAKERLVEAARTGEEVTFWIGTNPDLPDYTWTFNGALLEQSQAERLPPLELRIAVSEQSQSGRGTDTLVLDFAWQGELPIPAEIAVRLPAELADAARLKLYRLDSPTGRYLTEQDDIAIDGGYARFIIYGTEDLALSTQVLEGTSPVAGAGGGGSGGSNGGGGGAGNAGGQGLGASASEDATTASPAGFGLGFSALPWAVAALLTAVLLSVVAVTFFRRKRQREIADMEQGWLKGLPSIDELVAKEDGKAIGTKGNTGEDTREDAGEDTGEPVDDVAEPTADAIRSLPIVDA